MPNKRYTFNYDFGIFESPSSPINYSDGTEVEAYLLKAITESSDRSLGSSELISKIRDWPSEYHLSSLRGNLLRGFEFQPGTRVLELGSGCGAITRQLGEKGLEVTAVEGSRQRAHITRMRCSDLPNVTVYRDCISTFETADRFDVILLIGVLEYAPCFIEGADPVDDLLRKVASLLTPRGSLILAIENQLGLKYFNGHQEDHIGKPFWGIENLYQKKGPVTFGRKALERKICDAGFCHSDFYFPWPDYKLPTVIISPAGMQCESLQIPDLFLRAASRSYGANPQLSFDEGLARYAIWENQLGGDLSNSFLVIAHLKATEKSTVSTSWLATYFSIWNYRVRSETTFNRLSSGEIEVEKKQLLSPHSAIDSPSRLQWQHHASRYVVGGNFLRELLVVLARGGGLDEIASCLKPWVDFLKDASTETPQGERTLPGNFVDCVPFNLIVDAGGKIRVIDLEWVFETAVPFIWVVVRGLMTSLQLAKTKPGLEGKTYRECIEYILGRWKIPFNSDSTQTWITMETELLLFGAGRDPMSNDSFYQILSEPIGKGDVRWSQTIAEQSKVLVQYCNLLDDERQKTTALQNLIVELNTHIAALQDAKTTSEKSVSLLHETIQSITASKSWLLTAPLRALAARLKGQV